MGLFKIQPSIGRLFTCLTFLYGILFCVPISCNAESKPIDSLYFGMHIHRAERIPWPEIPFGSWRLWDAHVAWPNLEPQKGKWDFKLLDNYISLAQKHNIRVLLTLGLSPQWASARPDEKSAYGPGNIAEPKNINDWQNYVRTVATRYKGIIKEYEIWNEPNLKMFFTGEIKELLLLNKEAYKIIKEIDPNAIVVSPSATGKGGIPWLDKYLASGGKNYFDVVGYHFYLSNEPPEQLPAFIKSVKNIMQKYKISKPLWNTESGWWIGDSSKKPEWVNASWLKLLPSESSAYISRALILTAYSGIDRFYWYAWDNGDTGILNKQTGKAHEGGNAFMAISDWLIGRKIDSCDREFDGIWACSIIGKTTKVGEIIWSDTKTKTIPRSQKPGYTVYEQLDGSVKPLNSTNTISITGSPIFLKVIGTSKTQRIIKKNDERSVRTEPLYIRDEPIRVKNVPLILKP